MNSPNRNRSSAFESQLDIKQPDIKKVWLLNLIPYTGAGYFYAVGAKKAIKPMIVFWICMFISPFNLIPVYLILSALGTAHILNKNRADANRLQQAGLGENVESVPPGQQIPMTESSEFSLSTLDNKAKKAQKALKRIGSDDDDGKSKHAFEAFEYKAQAAEKVLKARNDAGATDHFDPDPAINFAPAAAPNFNDGESDQPDSVPAANAVSPQAPSVVPDVMDGSALTQSTISPAADSSDYITQVNNSYSIDSEVANITSGVNLGASANSLEVNNSLAQDSASNIADLKLAQFGDSLSSSQSSESSMTQMLADADQNTARIQSLDVVPEISSQVASSESYVPEVTAQYSTEALALPTDSEQSAPDVSSQFVKSDQAVPDVDSQLVQSNQAVPDVSSQFSDTSLTSLGNFETPKFSFSFEDHMAAAPVNAVAATGEAAAVTPCPKCGAARDPNFSFCLACGQSFL